MGFFVGGGGGGEGGVDVGVDYFKLIGWIIWLSFCNDWFCEIWVDCCWGCKVYGLLF